MRTRSKTNVLISSPVAPFYQNWVGHYDYTVGAGSAFIGRSDTEYMVDDPTGDRTYKEIIHKRKNLLRENVNSCVLTQGANVFQSTGTNCFWHEWNLGAHDFANHDHVPVSFAITEDRLLRETLHDFYTNNEVDSLLNVVESPELVTSLRSLSQKLSSVRKFNLRRESFSGLGRLEKIFNRRTLKGATSLISGGFLYYKFGIAPLLSDMNKIGRNLHSYSKQMKSVIQRAGSEVSVHRRAQGVILPVPGSLGRPLPDGIGLAPNQGKAWSGTFSQLPGYEGPVMTCTVRGIRETKYLSDAFQRLDFLASRFGSVGPASFAWERIPFSFVLDWFVDVSGVLDFLDNALTGNRKKVKSAGISVKWSALCEVFKLRYSDASISSIDGQLIAHDELFYYHRKSVDPSVSVGLSGRFGKSQASIAAALVAQIAANLRK
jgi:hypothetical protein